MKDREHLLCCQHHAMAACAGYLGVYAILCRNDFLGNAQTSNLIYLVTALLGHNIPEALLRIGAALLYMSGIALTVFWSKKWHRNPHYLSYAVDCIAVLVLGLLPADCNVVIGLYPIFFAMAIQWNSFSGAYGYVSSSIFSTNNLRQVANALSEYCITHDKKQLHKAKFFGGTLLCFHLGVALCFVLHPFFGIRSVWLCYLPLLVAGHYILTEYRQERQALKRTQRCGQT
ncbi:MAG: YoaK family protein [Butyricicoccus sp.]